MEYEIIDSLELATRWAVPESWVRSRSRERCPKDERIPCVRWGRYVRYRWNSPELNAYLERHMEGGHG